MSRLLIALVLAGCAVESQDQLLAENRPLHGSAAIIAEHLEPLPHDSLATVSPSFDAHFEALGALPLSGEVLMDDLSTLEVSPGGLLLARGWRGEKPLLFASDGSLVAELTPEECHPGHEFYVNAASFFQDDTILVLSGPAVPLLFDPNGNCTGAWEAPHFADHTRAAADGTVYQYFRRPDSLTVTLHDVSGNLVEAWAVDVALPELSSRRTGGGLVYSATGTAYLNLSIDGAVRVYERGEPEKWTGTPPDYYQAPTEDLPDVRGIDELMAAMRELAPSSWTTQLFLLDEDRLMQGFLNRHIEDRDSPEVLALRVMDTEGNTLESEPIFFGGQRIGWVGAADGVLYRSLPPTGEDDNPTLILYRFTG